MANELNAGIGETGLTVTAQLYIAGAASGAPISCPEIGTTGVYTGTMAGAAGTYGVAFLASSVIRAYGEIVWDGSTEVLLSSLATAANLATVDGIVDAILLDTAEIGAAGAGLTVLATQASVDLVKAQTDKMVFTVANQIDANIQYVNDVQVTGTGAAGDTWGP